MAWAVLFVGRQSNIRNALAHPRRIPGTLTEDANACTQRDKMRWTAMHRAAGNGHSDVVKILVAAGCAPNAADSQNYTALHEAVWCGHLGSCQALLEAGADPFCADLYGNTPIDLATAQARKGRADLLELLTSAKDRSDGDGVERKVASESTGSAGGGRRRASDG